MKLAQCGDFDEIKNIFYQYKDIFPHVRTDYIMRQIESNNCVYDNGIVITFNFYKKPQKIGTVEARPGHCILHQIVRDKDNKDASAASVMKSFFEWTMTDVWLSVRRDNEVAKKFYERNGMKKMGEIHWARHTLPGDVYLYQRTIPLI